MLALWEKLVNTESDSQDKESVDKLAAWLRGYLAADGAEACIVEFERTGNLVIGTYGASRPAAPVAFLGHFDTVFAKGTAAARPFRLQDGRAYGPGVLDMKGGIVVLLYAIRALEAAGYTARPLKVVLAGDEEIAHGASPTADAFMQAVRGAAAAFNCETGSPANEIVVGRKGGLTYAMEAHGVAAHTGNNPQSGRSAILELAHKVIDIHALTDWNSGTSYNVGAIQGGKGCNTTPDYARIDIGVRCVSEAAAQEVERKLQAIADRQYVDGTRTELIVGSGFMPMATTAAGQALFALVDRASQENGFGRLTAVQSGGASDSAYAVMAGVPTVCAMGVKGENNHSPAEYALVESLFERAKLLAACVLKLDETTLD